MRSMFLYILLEGFNIEELANNVVYTVYVSRMLRRNECMVN